MQINIASDSFSKSRIAMEFVDNIEAHEIELSLENSIMYYEFPIFKEIDQTIELYPSFTIISPNHGLIIIKLDERSHRTISDRDISKLFENIDQIYGFILSKLIKFPRLKKNRNQLNFEISTVLFLPNYHKKTDIDSENTVIATNFGDLKTLLERVKREPINEEQLGEICAIIEGSKGLPRPKDRNITDANRHKKGGLLEELDKEIAKFDEQQKIAALTQFDGPQRIRGLAGSGKTVVLAMKAALIHLRKPEAKLLYTFYTKSLYDHVKNLITRFYRMHEDHDPNWDKIHIRHAWGGASLPGVYYDACKANKIGPITFTEAKNRGRNAFDVVCRDLLDKTNANLQKIYDYVLMDEGQDFEPSFYWLCRSIVKNDCLVWAYDELQNILKVDLQETNKVFKNKYGQEGIDLEKLQEQFPRQNNDIVLHKCYRNPKEILVVAHAIGFGIYNDHILQTLENKEHWQDLGYEVVKGNCNQGEDTVIHRPDKNSPSAISSKQTVEEIIKWYPANGIEDEVNWVCDSIIRDLEEHVLPEDILVISIDDRYARRYFDKISDILGNKSISTNNILNSYTGDDFMIDNCVTLSTVYRAKGNEAAIVYVIGTDYFNSSKKDDITERNKVFTAFTRAKAWLRISGIGNKMGFLLNELEQAINNFPNLCFIYPGKEEIKTLRRELAEANQIKNKKMKALQEKIEELGLDYDEAINILQIGRKDK